MQTHEIANMKFWEFLCIYFYIIIHIILYHFVPCNFECFYVLSRNTLKNIFLNAFIKINTFFPKLKIASFLSLFYAIVYFVLPFFIRFNLCRIIFDGENFQFFTNIFAFSYSFSVEIFSTTKDSFHKNKASLHVWKSFAYEKFEISAQAICGKNRGANISALGRCDG